MFLILFIPAPVTPNIWSSSATQVGPRSSSAGAYGDDDAIGQQRLEGNRHGGGVVGLFNRVSLDHNSRNGIGVVHEALVAWLSEIQLRSSRFSTVAKVIQIGESLAGRRGVASGIQALWRGLGLWVLAGARTRILHQTDD